MIGAKFNAKAYAAAGEKKKKNEFTLEETLLTHYDTLDAKTKKIAANYFQDNYAEQNGFEGLVLNEAIQEYLIEIKANVPFPGPDKEEAKFTFIDLFAGIGGFRMALQNLGGRCVFSSEWDKAAQQTYRMNYGDIPFGDITKIEIQNLIPKRFDVLCAGFPCQPFSRAGVSARNFLGLQHGFDHPTQGNLFFEIVKIAAKHRPKVLFLENVKNLKTHDGGNTFATIERMIKEIGYTFYYKVINADTEVPQRRERTYMVCFRDEGINFKFPDFEGPKKKLGNYLEQNVSVYYTLSDAMWQGHIKRSKRNKDRGTGFTVSLADVNKPSNTIVARYYKDGKECLIAQPDANPRMLTPRECARLQGFPETFIYSASRKAAYQQFGNSVAVPVIKKIGAEIIKTLNF